jgi:hypothetical protein
MAIFRRAVPAIVALAVAGWVSAAETLLPADRRVDEVVDHYIDARLANEKVQPAPRADDATLVRRLTLDLDGRIPTEAEARAFVESTDPDKAIKLVDRLMTGPGFTRHQADTFDAMIMAGTRGDLREFLTRAFGENRPWDQVFRELLVADESDAARKGSAAFVKSRVKDLDRLTSDVSSVFFGVNVSCAKCHDHPKVKDWKQDHYYGMKSFLGRTYEAGSFVGERDYGMIKFKTTDGEERKAKFMFLTGRVVDVPGGEQPSKEAREADKKPRTAARKNQTPPTPPKVSARAKLVEVALEPGEREFFARAIVNRTWNRFFGAGLVMPLDQMHSQNPPSHPELLQWLARDMIDHRYDLRRLIRGLVLSRAYARSSRSEAAEPPSPRLFAVAAVRPLTPVQLATSMWVGTTDPARLPADAPPDAHDRAIEALANRARTLAGAIARPGDEYQIGASEALLMSNSDRLKELLADGGDRLVGRLMRIADRRARVALAVRAILSRPADEEEIALLSKVFDGYKEPSPDRCRQLVWVLLTCAEFRFNY